MNAKNVQRSIWFCFFFSISSTINSLGAAEGLQPSLEVPAKKATATPGNNEFCV